MNAEELRPALSAVLRPILGAAVTVEDLHVLTGGASRTTWAFSAATDEGRRQFILRTAPRDEVPASMELEARVQTLAAAAGAPVPEILTADDSPDALGNPYLICNAIPGETIVRRIQRRLDAPARSRLLQQCATALAAIHSADPDAADLQPIDPLGRWRDQIDEIGDTTATFEWALRWLERHQNELHVSAPTLVHGDFRMGNFIVDVEGGTGLRAVLDWELVHSGQIYEDLAWFCVRAWRFGAPSEMAAGGLGSIEEFLQAYQRASGNEVDFRTFRWWLVQATLQWGVICRIQAERHLSGQTRSVELATIGRRVCENEWDLLDLLEDRVVA